jgi:hypothetical protein
MKLFTIDNDNAIVLHGSAAQAPKDDDLIRFSTQREFEKIAKAMPGERLIAIWNSFAGVVPFDDLRPVKKFTDRKSAISRIWKAIQRLEATAAPEKAETAPKGKRAPKKVRTEPKGKSREGSKKATVIDMLRRAEGATLAEIMTATGWQPHSVRGFISGSLGKKMGIPVESFKSPEGERAYKITAK